MRTKLDPDDELFIPDVSEWDWSKAEIGRRGKRPGETTEICVEGAIGYSLRLIPSNKILDRFDSTLEAWPVVIRAIEGGRSPRTLSLDADFPDGRRESISAGRRLEGVARINDGQPHPYPGRLAAVPANRVAER